ncbi:MAG: hypothetical protein HOE48_14030, partial [Candidatus Latescibacteria bacterium]|nr:hypothetical protein [Candidatus Latescibacterota bacterium]
IFNTAEIHGNVKKTQFHLGVPTTRAETILARSRNLQELKSTQGDLKQQVESARRSLDKLLKVTGVVFNLNLGRIVRQSEVGLQIDLSSFYKALPGRSAAEVDTALRQFFAKAVMGLLTRLNRDYIASGRGHQVRFKSVVAKLQDLVLKSREYDKCVHLFLDDTEHIVAFCERYALDKSKVSIGGAIQDSCEVTIQGLELVGAEKQAVVKDFRLQIENGQRDGTQEAKFYCGKNLKDMEFVSKGSLRNVLIWVADGQIRWEFRS